MTIVLAHADSEPGRAALVAALREATDHAERLVVVPATRGAHLTVEAVTEEAPDLVRALLAAGGEVVVEEGSVGDPSDAVVQVAQRHDARLVVVGLRHRSPVGKAILGSTAQRILLDATCPVLAVKPG
ncbi:nucleotide-binding universal stress UspA family protein [Nocardioides zeae]|uniref:Nucleotide-binding universal stress UspA family protein n=2 Tax=Nocardioides zeae TaxID=1457234 RepID=A0AAJ1U4D1_9ACTN|nr:universal stress protein [Nocardioides zeae]MDQ1105645.1 nucleotide-binding universal stress UspA family protein [Nocardioides zeae]MDR6174705.1 nucleotide-binding universal stress UspA family protein [Nocardioides zeae]MDR6210774.1 nucleotide-binding universal stress UspA family protein [Nocardioides zeae]